MIWMECIPFHHRSPSNENECEKKTKNEWIQCRLGKNNSTRNKRRPKKMVCRWPIHNRITNGFTFLFICSFNNCIIFFFPISAVFFIIIYGLIYIRWMSPFVCLSHIYHFPLILFYIESNVCSENYSFSILHFSSRPHTCKW